MSKSVLLSRSARFCAGRVPLALLLQKLARLGETAAIRALHELSPVPRPLDAVRERPDRGDGIMATYRLTSLRTLGHVEHPNCKRRIRRLCHCFPGMVKRAGFLDPCHRCTLFLRVRLDIRQGDVRVSVRPRKPLTGLGASPCLFYLRRSTIPNCKRCRMFSRFFAEVA